MDMTSAKTTHSNAMKRLTEGGTYTFKQLQAVAGKAMADHVRALCGLTPPPTPTTPKRAPRKRASAAPAPVRAARNSGRLGDRLARS